MDEVLIRNEMRMSVHFTFLHGVEVERETRSYVEKKVKAAGKALDASFKADVEIEQDKKEKYLVSVSLRCKGEAFRASDTAEKIEKAIDTVEDELQEQIRDWKERQQDLDRRRGRSGKKNSTVAEEARF